MIFSWSRFTVAGVFISISDYELPTRQELAVLIGQTVSHYKVLEKIGGGGMGVVYRAEDTRLKRPVALKFLPPDLTRDPDAKARFIHEAQTASALDHRNICNIHEIEETEDERLFIAMACYEGETLKQKLQKGPMTVAASLNIASQIADGLERAHDAGITHRDIKPGNIMVTPHGEVKILDFGLAKLTGQSRLTKDGSTLGTIAYMSPEQARGDHVDHQSDIWSLGTLLYEMVTGRQAFTGDYDQAVIYSILHENPVPMSKMTRGLPRGLEQIVNFCLKKDVSKRYASVKELKTDLEVLSVQSKPRTTHQLRRKSIRIKPKQSTWKRILPFASGLLLLALILNIPSLRRPIGRFFGLAPMPRSVALLPFELMGGDEEDREFSEGLLVHMTEMLNRMEPFNRSYWTVPYIGIRNHGITTIQDAQKFYACNTTVSGTIQPVGEMYRVTLQRHEVDTRSLSSSASAPYMSEFTQPISNLMTWQMDVSNHLAELLDVTLDEDVLTHLKKGCTTIPEAFELYLRGFARLHPFHIEQDLDRAMDCFAEAVRIDSSYASAFVARAKAIWAKYRAQDTNQLNNALGCLRRAIQLDDDIAEAYYYMGHIFYRMRQYERAVDHFHDALERDPAHLQSIAELARSYEYLGMYPEAEKIHKRAIRTRPNYRMPHNNLGTFYIRIGRFEDALKPLQRMIELSPGYYRGYSNLGGLYYFLDRFEEAERTYQRAIRIQKNYIAYLNLGTMSFYDSRFGDAIRYNRSALEMNNADFRIWGNLGDAYYWSPAKRDTAIVYYRKAIEKCLEILASRPGDPYVLAKLAGYYEKTNEISRAGEIIGRLIQNENLSNEVMFNIGDVYEQLDEREKALEWIGKAIADGYSSYRILHDPGMQNMQTDRRFREIMEKRQKKRKD